MRSNDEASERTYNENCVWYVFFVSGCYSCSAVLTSIHTVWFYFVVFSIRAMCAMKTRKEKYIESRLFTFYVMRMRALWFFTVNIELFTCSLNLNSSLMSTNQLSNIMSVFVYVYRYHFSGLTWGMRNKREVKRIWNIVLTLMNFYIVGFGFMVP